MRTILVIAAISALLVVGVFIWLSVREPSSAQAARIARVLTDESPADAPRSYAHCASCHMHDGSGRPDGSIPRLNGQRRAVLENKLYRLRAGTLRLPVMDPYARTLHIDEVAELARYLSSLPETAPGPGVADAATREQGAALYAAQCASCHGANGEGNDGLFASRLCGQYAGYLERRLVEAADGTRGAADAIMTGIVASVPQESLAPIVAWLAAGEGCVAQ